MRGALVGKLDRELISVYNVSELECSPCTGQLLEIDKGVNIDHGQVLAIFGTQI